ncbi:MAG: pantetheine-phosphate adenylyltransferase [Nakamurella sp.]
MTHVLCPGSFDPPTLGHLDIFERAVDLFDYVTVAVVVNPSKTGLFSVDERVELLRTVTARWDTVDVDSSDGLLVDYCTRRGITGIVKGIRTADDVSYELQMAQMNAHLTNVRTILLPTAPEYSFISSSLVRQVARLGGDVSDLLPDEIAEALVERFRPGTPAP